MKNVCFPLGRGYLDCRDRNYCLEAYILARASVREEHGRKKAVVRPAEASPSRLVRVTRAGSYYKLKDTLQWYRDVGLLVERPDGLLECRLDGGVPFTKVEYRVADWMAAHLTPRQCKLYAWMRGLDATNRRKTCYMAASKACGYGELSETVKRVGQDMRRLAAMGAVELARSGQWTIVTGVYDLWDE